MTKAPFQTVVLNHLEVISLLASMTTIYCGIFYIVEVSMTDIEEMKTTTNQGSKACINNIYSLIGRANQSFFLLCDPLFEPCLPHLLGNHDVSRGQIHAY